MKSGIACAIVLLASVLAVACKPASGVPQTPASQAEPASPPKRIAIGIIQEPRGWAPWGGSSTAGGAQQPYWLTTRTLTIVDDQGRVRPVLAESVPSLDDGSWRFATGGEMEQTWTIRRGAKWHDGRAVTADDFVFGWEIARAPDLPTTARDARDLIGEAIAVDDQTLLLRFRGTTPLAGQALFDPYPRHILGESFAQPDHEQFSNHAYWMTEYVSAGPYRLADWQLGAYQELAAFPEYVEGKPRIDQITVRFLGDANTLLANVLSGDVEVALPDGLSVEMAKELQQGWAAQGTGNNVVLSADGRMFRMYFQHRPDYARPRGALDPRVRRAFYETIDKPGVNDVELAGLGRLADSWILPDDPRLPQFADAIPRWTHDLGTAERLLDEAGWQRGPDGVRVHSGTGERLETEIRVTPSQGHVKSLAVMAAGWRQAGVDVKEAVMPASLVRDGEYKSTLPFAALYGHRIGLQWEAQHYRCVRAASPSNRWTGTQHGYCNDAAEPLINQLQVTVAPDERTPLQVAIMRMVLKDDFAELPLYWQVTPYVFAKGLTGIGHLSPGAFGNTQSPWNAHLWDRS